MIKLVNIKDGQAVVSSREVAENFEKNHQHVLRDIESLKKDVSKIGQMFYETTLLDSYEREQKAFLMNRDGFTILAMGFTGKKALEWKLKYIEAFNQMEETIKSNQLDTSQLSPQTQVLINLELKQAELETAIIDTKTEIQDMRDIIKLDTTSWRQDASELISKIALKLGGFEHIKDVRKESYKLLDERMGVALSIRLTNKRRRMAEEGVSKSKRDKLNYLDIIAEDKKLVEGYIAIIKEMAIKYGA